MKQPTFIQTLAEDPVLNYLHGMLDGLYLSGSMISYSSTLWTSDPTMAEIQSDAIYAGPEFPWVWLGVAAFTSLSMIANRRRCSSMADQKQFELSLERKIQLYWPYVRDFLSGLKNGRHAVVNLGFLLQHATTAPVYAICNPVGIAVGALLCLNLVMLRSMNQKRQEAIKQNEKLLMILQTQGQSVLTSGQTIIRHTMGKKSLNYLMVTFDGLTDGMYLFGCLFTLVGLGLSALSCGAPLIIAAVGIASYTVLSLISKWHEEYEKQKGLDKSVDACLLELAKNRLQAAEQKFQRAQLYFKKNLITEEVFLTVKSEYEEAKTAYYQQQSLFIEKYEHERHFECGSSAGTYLWFIGRALLSGAKNAYAAIQTVSKLFFNMLSKILFACLCAVAMAVYTPYLAIKYMANTNNPKDKKAKSTEKVVSSMRSMGVFATSPKRRESERRESEIGRMPGPRMESWA